MNDRRTQQFQAQALRAALNCQPLDGPVSDERSRRRKTVLISLGAYSLFVATALSESWVAGSELLLFVWPHIALIALQEPLGGQGEVQVWLLLAIGGAAVVLASWLLSQFSTVARRPWPAGVGIAAATVVLLSILSFVLALLLGWQVAV